MILIRVPLPAGLWRHVTDDEVERSTQGLRVDRESVDGEDLRMRRERDIGVV
jgi:hypothetical protein